MQRVISLDPGNVVDDVVHGQNGAVRTREGDGAAEARQTDRRRGRCACSLTALPRKAPADAVHQIRPQQRGVAQRKTFAVIQHLGGWRLSGKFGCAAGVVILQVAAPEHSVASIGGDGPVDFGDVRVEFARFIGGETKTREIQAVAHRNVVGQGVALQDAENGLARSDALGIHRAYLVGRQADGRPVVREVVDVTLPQIGGRHFAYDALRFAVAAAFIVGEEKHAILLEGPAERRAVDVAQ